MAKPRSPSGSVRRRCSVHASEQSNSTASPTLRLRDSSPMLVEERGARRLVLRRAAELQAVDVEGAVDALGDRRPEAAEAADDRGVAALFAHLGELHLHGEIDLVARAGLHGRAGHLRAHDEVGGAGLLGGDGAARRHPDEVGAADVAGIEALLHGEARVLGRRIALRLPERRHRDGERAGVALRDEDGRVAVDGVVERVGAAGALGEPVDEEGGGVCQRAVGHCSLCERRRHLTPGLRPPPLHVVERPMISVLVMEPQCHRGC